MRFWIGCSEIFVWQQVNYLSTTCRITVFRQVAYRSALRNEYRNEMLFFHKLIEPACIGWYFFTLVETHIGSTVDSIHLWPSAGEVIAGKISNHPPFVTRPRRVGLHRCHGWMKKEAPTLQPAILKQSVMRSHQEVPRHFVSHHHHLHS